jgi:hypothetical protein
MFSQKTKQIFNGKDLENWQIVLSDDTKKPEEVFFVENGVLNITGFPDGYVRTKEKYKNFELTLEWRWGGQPANSGVLHNITGDDKVWPDCIEAQLQHENAENIVYINNGAKAFINTAVKEKVPTVDLGNKWNINSLIFSISKLNASSEKTPGEWNKYRIVFKNEILEYYVNDILQNSTNIIYTEGYIGLQSEGGHIQFRNILITEF